MSEFHKEILTEIINSWDTEQLKLYIDNLEYREKDLVKHIKELKQILKKKVRRTVRDTGVRDGR